MLKFMPPFFRGCLASLLLALSTLIWCIPLFFFTLLKLVIPIPAWRRLCAKLSIAVAELWMFFNSGWMRLTQPMDWDVEGLESLDKEHWYMVTANHQSWADIHIVQHLFNRRIPMLKFFLKQELIWVPVIGLCWWALDFPFMKRYSRDYLKRHPEKKGKDLETTRKACEKFKHTPIAIFNFIEGTRFTKAKQKKQSSPFRYLLKPKAGGMGFVLGAMGEQLKSLVNVTIVYPGHMAPSYWDFLCGKIDKVVVRVKVQDIPEQLRGKDYLNNREFRAEFQKWVNALWQAKDKEIAELLTTTPPRTELLSDK